MPEWALAIVPQATNIWAPDASLVNGVWHVYYAVSSYGSPVSVIGLVTTPSLASPVWTDRGLVIRSDKADNFNAIDPTLVEDTSSTPPSYWLVFGSFWSGIKAVRIDAATGKIAGDNTTVISLAQRPPPDALEGAFMVVRPDAHYLFVSWDYCCQGTMSNYSVHVGRSTHGFQGPYVDRNGVAMLEGGGSLFLGRGHGWAGGGGEGFLKSTTLAGRTVSTMILHAYDGRSGDPFMQLVDVAWGPDGWPMVAPASTTTTAASA
jgi:arabinan endo-1,5-alpha-L-arabinosidase